MRYTCLQVSDRRKTPGTRRLGEGILLNSDGFFLVVNRRVLRYKVVMEKRPIHISDGCKPEIDYPCLWQYKVIATDCLQVRQIVEEHLGDAPYSLSESNKSSGGKYVSMNLELTVYSDYHRLRIYEGLTAHPAVKVVL